MGNGGFHQTSGLQAYNAHAIIIEIDTNEIKCRAKGGKVKTQMQNV